MPTRSVLIAKLLFLLAVVFPSIASAHVDAAAYPAPGTYVWVNGLRLHIYCLGEGSPTVVFDSGLGGTSLDWARVHTEVARFTRACVYDRAGYGWSDRAPRPRHSINIVSELDQLLGYGSIAAPYVMVGHSFGGLNVRLFASRYPRKIAGLVLVDSSHEDQFERFEQAGLIRIAPQNRQFMLRNYDQIPGGLPEELRAIAQAFAVSADSMVSLHSELAHLQISARQVRASSPLPDVPLVVITRSTNGLVSSAGSGGGELSQLWLDMQRDLSKRTSRSSLIIARTREHYIQLSEPAVVVGAIRDVLEAAGQAASCDSLPPPIQC